ncbi:FAD-dependent monooxygenase [Crossiella sp. SN42]|uniref:FAD-dependent monooxygenase n=1 Tax=Crossiella sp. SN42 TaxID=2944808 RepID=UPI00207C7792|nr:FAD-dependent monooxygenase [Crossiella sp. SN42]MCO1580433.1 FAD-dependent monooxygenase [Crossiella sp. SN42]
MTDADVIIVGAGPTGLMLAGELRLAGVRPLVLERQPELRDIPKAGGLGGQVLELLRYRGVLDKLVAATTGPLPPPRFPFGGVHVDLTRLPDPPMHALPLPQARLERVLEDHALGLDTEIRRGHEVLGVRQDEGGVTAEVRGPDGPYEVRGKYLVGCDGPRSPVRELAGIPFPGTAYPEVNRFAHVTLPDSVRVLDNGDLDIAGQHRISAGFTRTERGVFAFGPLAPGALMVYTTEDEFTQPEDDAPMTLAEVSESVRRVLGVDLPMGEASRLSRYRHQARQAERYRDGRILLAGDAAHQFPATGVGLNAGLLDAVNLAWKLAAELQGWAPDGLLETYHRERHFAGARTLQHTQAQVALRRGQDAAADALRAVFLELLADEPAARRIGAMIAGSDFRYPLPGADRHPLVGAFAPDLALHTDQGGTSVAELLATGRPVLLDLTGRADLHEVAADWRHRVDLVTAKTEDRPADLLLIRPDAHIAWAAGIDESADTAAPALREALATWFGDPAAR